MSWEFEIRNVQWRLCTEDGLSCLRLCCLSSVSIFGRTSFNVCVLILTVHRFAADLVSSSHVQKLPYCDFEDDFVNASGAGINNLSR